jgi:Tfp pilus assembly protein PilW
MKAGKFKFYIPLVASLIGLFPASVGAEFRCTTDVSYRWVKGGAGPSVAVTGSGASVSAAAESAPSPQSPGASDANVVRLMGVERGGSDEAIARQSLQVEVDRQRVRASESCKRDHESFGSCVAMKLSARASVLNSLSFSARSELEKALSDECRQQEGTCLGVEVGEPKCAETVGAKPTPPTPPPPPAAPEKKPEAKKK